MAKPNIDLKPEPVQDGAITYQMLAPASKNGELEAQVSLLLEIKNLQPHQIVLSNVKISVAGPGFTKILTSHPVTIKILPASSGGVQTQFKGYWYTVVDWATKINQNLIIPPEADSIEISLSFWNFSEPVTKKLALRPHRSPTPEQAYAFPAKAEDLLFGECWESAAAVHNSSEYGCQLFALDLGVFGWDPKRQAWSGVLPDLDGKHNRHYRIWEKPLYAMSDGEVFKVRWDFPENPTPVANAPADLPRQIRNEIDKVKDGNGNFISLATGDEVHTYAHLKFNTIPEHLRVGGAEVKKGDFIGLVGNSGVSTNPHTHIQIVKKRIRQHPGDASFILRPMPFTEIYSINSELVKSIDRNDPWFKHTGQGLSRRTNNNPLNKCLIYPAATMPKSLTLKEFRCIQESVTELFDEPDMGSTGDSPYFLVFIGNYYAGYASSNLFRVRRQSWDEEVDAGELFSPGIEISNQLNRRSLVLVALMEEDKNTDVVEERMDNLRQQMRNDFSLVTANKNVTNAHIRAYLETKFSFYIAAAIVNDECLGVKRLEITTDSGPLPLLEFKGGGASYRVRFEMA